MEKILVLVCALILTCVANVKAEQSVYVLGGPSFGTFYTDDDFINGVIGYERDFYDRWSIALELQKSHRTNPEPGNKYSFTPVLRYWFFDFRTIKTYGLGGIGFTTHDLGSIHDGDKNGHRSSGDALYHIVAGVGIEKKFDWLSLVSEVRYEHESNLNGNKNYGGDGIAVFFGIKYNFGKRKSNVRKEIDDSFIAEKY